MVLGVEWSAQDAFRGSAFREWYAAGEVAGKVRSGGGMSFVTVLGAGHLVSFPHKGSRCVLITDDVVDTLRPASPGFGSNPAMVRRRWHVDGRM